MISKLNKKLFESIQKYGENSTISKVLKKELDEELVEYYKTSMLKYYEDSLEGLKIYRKEYKRKPRVAEWNKYAKENNYLSNESMRYMKKSLKQFEK